MESNIQNKNNMDILNSQPLLCKCSPLKKSKFFSSSLQYNKNSLPISTKVYTSKPSPDDKINEITKCGINFIVIY